MQRTALDTTLPPCPVPVVSREIVIERVELEDGWCSLCHRSGVCCAVRLRNPGAEFDAKKLHHIICAACVRRMAAAVEP